MGLFFIYSLKVAFCLIAFYLVFKLLLSKETFHTFNRCVLLLVMVISILLPWLKVTTAEPTAIEEIEEDPDDKVSIMAINGSIEVGDTHGQWVYVYDVYGTLWYKSPAAPYGVSLPGPRVYIVRVGKTVRKVFVDR